MNSSILKIVGLFLAMLVIILVTAFGVMGDFVGKGGASKEEIEQIVAEYIKNNPQAIIDSVTMHQQKAMAEEDIKSQAVLKDKLEEIENDKTAPVGGNPKGDVVFIEFFDYSCGFCKKVFPSVEKLINEDKNLKVVFKEFPILGPNSELASRAALSVNMVEPAKYFEFHKKLMENRITGQDSINTILTELGLDPKIVAEKMKSKEIEEIIVKDRELAYSIGVRGTPAFIIGGELVPGAVDEATLKELIAKARKK